MYTGTQLQMTCLVQVFQPAEQIRFKERLEKVESGKLASQDPFTL